MFSRLTITLVIVATLGACASEAAEEAFTVTDSAGVAIAVSHEPLWPEGRGWRLGGQPSVLIGGGITDTSAIVGPIAGAMRLPDGRILVADAGATRLRWFADDGTILQSVGRKGEGPGEMQRMDALLHVGDSIAILDGSTARVSVFSLDGVFGRRFKMAAPPKSAFALRIIGRLATGEWIGRTGSSVREVPSGIRRDTFEIWLSGSDGGVGRHVADVLGGEALVVNGGTWGAVTRAPFEHETTVHFHDGDLWVGTGDEFRVDQFALSGELLRSVRLAEAPTPISTSELDAVLDSARDHYAEMNDRMREGFTRVLEEAPRPTVKPAYTSFLLDDDDNIWIARYGSGPALPSHWSVIDTAGRWLGDVPLPPGFEPTHVGTDEVLGVWTDPDGLERVVAYPLIRDSTGM
ncbi:MAG TPA: 6-bladed beta-propeller [Gemmatimonadales bacterium]|nr:6-bladed beta-propeller [Gemmatimonadales bacterium]